MYIYIYLEVLPQMPACPLLTVPPLHASLVADEARHFSQLLKRLRECGSDYGALPAHDGLWQSAEATSASLPARLAVEHCTHEARGLDVVPPMIARFRAGGDAASADLLETVIYPEEITHCAAGVRWLRWLHRHALDRRRDSGSSGGDTAGGRGSELPEWAEEARRHESVETWFHTLVRRHFHGSLKPPFNEEARAKAGFGPEWYLPLAAPSASTPAAG